MRYKQWPASPRVALEPTWPAKHGGRVDIWGRYEGLRSKGWDQALVTWTYPKQISADDREGLPTAFSTMVEIPLHPSPVAGLGRLWRMTRTSGFQASTSSDLDRSPHGVKQGVWAAWAGR